MDKPEKRVLLKYFGVEKLGLMTQGLPQPDIQWEDLVISLMRCNIS
jgi:hypothetical protein